MTPLVSIIIPVYNGLKYIESSIRSALDQTYCKIEVIAVNDGSTDGSLDVMRRLALSDNRLTVLDQPNSGVTAARVAGIDRSTGSWICFLDADDTLPATAVEQYSSLFDTGSDIIISGYCDSLGKAEYLSSLLRLKIRPELWGKCLKSELVKTHMPRLDRSIAMGEDLIQNLVLGMNAASVSTVPELLYSINLDNQRSVTRTFRRTEEYESAFFDLIDRLCLDRCRELPEYDIIVESALWSKLNGLKQVVLDGNHFDPGCQLWKQIRQFYRINSQAFKSLGPSEKLLLALPSLQSPYRVILSILH